LAEPLAVFPELSRIIIAFTVRSILKVEPIGTVGGFTIDEVSVPPYQKDYDVDAAEGPSRCAPVRCAPKRRNNQGKSWRQKNYRQMSEPKSSHS
jgi:hypothetical protein